jgi:hypothetical protein
MSSHKNRIQQLEKARAASKPTWKDLLTGKWKPTQKQWFSHLMAVDIYDSARGWADTFTEDEAARVLSGDIDAVLAEKLLTVPAELKPVLDELEALISVSLGDKLQSLGDKLQEVMQ